MAGGGGISGPEYRRGSTRHKAAEERGGTEGNLHQAGYSRQSCCSDPEAQDRGQDPRGGAPYGSCTPPPPPISPHTQKSEGVGGFGCLDLIRGVQTR